MFQKKSRYELKQSMEVYYHTINVSNLGCFQDVNSFYSRNVNSNRADEIIVITIED